MTNKRLLLLLLSAAVSLSAMPLQAAAFTSTVSKIKIVKTVNFRDQPSTSGNRIRYLQAGELVELLGEPNGYWYEVRDSAGKSGYVSSSETYVEKTAVAVPTDANGRIVSSVSFRTAPSTDASRIRYLKAGEAVLILEKVNSYWYKVQASDNAIGYVSASSQYIDTKFGQSTPPPQTPVEPLFPSEPNASVVSSVAFRTGPSTDAARIRYLQKDEKLLILDKTNDYWYNVQDKDGKIGFVSASEKYISSRFIEPYKLLTPEVAAKRVIEAGQRYLGVPYEFGSSRYDTATFDCSDFVRQAFLDGIDQMLPGDSRSQGAYVKAVGKTSTNWRQLKKGDLMFFMSYKGSSAADYSSVNKATETITHVGIYLGDGRVLHTYSVESGGVRIDNLASTPWELRFLYGGSTY